MEELQLRLLEKTAHDKVLFILGLKGHFLFLKKWLHHPKKVITLNMYIGTNVLVYERLLLFCTRPAQRFRHSILTLLMHVSQIVKNIIANFLHAFA